MIEFEGVVLLPVDTASAQLMVSLVEPTEGAMLDASLAPDVHAGDGAMLQELSAEAEDEWIVTLASTASSEAVAIGMLNPSELVLLDRLSDDGPEIVITGKRGYEADWGTGSGDGGSGGSTGGSGGGGTGGTATPAEQHTEDCGTEDGAAVQVAKHVTGELPAGVSGPEDPVTTASGNDWTKVEFGAVIVRNPNGTFGALNDMIYSSDQPGYAALPNSVGQPVQGIWHSHPLRGDDLQQAIDRYPSPRDWDALARIGGQAGAVADPSIWITDPKGITREFKLSEKDYFNQLDDDVNRMKAGEGLEGRDRTRSCG